MKAPVKIVFPLVLFIFPAALYRVAGSRRPLVFGANSNESAQEWISMVFG